MWFPDFIQKRIAKGKVLLIENHPKNERLLTAYLRKYRLKAVHANTFEEAKKILEKKKVLGVIIDHTFRNDKEHTGQDLVRYVRRENESLRGMPIFLVSVVDTAELQEYEYLKINQYFDIEESTVAVAIREMEPYFIERD